MKITALKATPVAIADPPLLNAAGLHAPYALRIILQLETDRGITGISEMPGNIDSLHFLEQAADAVAGEVYKYTGAGGELGFERDPLAIGWRAARQDQALTSKEIVSQAHAMCEEFGFRSLKLKGGVFSPDLETETVIALRESFGDNIPIRIDPNGSWKIETALDVAQKLEGIIEYLEDPVRG